MDFVSEEPLDTKYVVKISLQIPTEACEVSISLHPIYDVLQEYLREPCELLSREEAKNRATQEGMETIDPLDAIYSIGHFGRALEEYCRANKPLVIAEDSKHYPPRFGRERDEIHLEVNRCYQYGYDNWSGTWNLMVVEGELIVTPLSGLVCREHEEVSDDCGFVLSLTLYGHTAIARKVAFAIQAQLAKAYQV